MHMGSCLGVNQSFGSSMSGLSTQTGSSFPGSLVESSSSTGPFSRRYWGLNLRTSTTEPHPSLGLGLFQSIGWLHHYLPCLGMPSPVALAVPWDCTWTWMAETYPGFFFFAGGGVCPPCPRATGSSRTASLLPPASSSCDPVFCQLPLAVTLPPTAGSSCAPVLLPPPHQRKLCCGSPTSQPAQIVPLFPCPPPQLLAQAASLISASHHRQCKLPAVTLLPHCWLQLCPCSPTPPPVQVMSLLSHSPPPPQLPLA